MSLTDGITFTATSQTKLESIDKYTPVASASIAFNESSYGTVAVQNYGSYGQKSFVFSYCLAELTDGLSPCTRDSLIIRIMRDFTEPGNNMMEVPSITIATTRDSIALSWDAVPYALSYAIETSDDPYSGFIREIVTAQTHWSTAVTASRKFYRVIARSSGL